MIFSFKVNYTINIYMENYDKNKSWMYSMLMNCCVGVPLAMKSDEHDIMWMEK
jgi:hypothetical protein